MKGIRKLFRVRVYVANQTVSGAVRTYDYMISKRGCTAFLKRTTAGDHVSCDARHSACSELSIQKITVSRLVLCRQGDLEFYDWGQERTVWLATEKEAVPVEVSA